MSMKYPPYLRINSYLATKMVFDLAEFDGSRSFILDDLVELLDTHYVGNRYAQLVELEGNACTRESFALVA